MVIQIMYVYQVKRNKLVMHCKGNQTPCRIWTQASATMVIYLEYEEWEELLAVFALQSSTKSHWNNIVQVCFPLKIF
jgi:hypothetical protein